MGAENITIPLAIVAGLLSFASPCVLPLVPVYLSYLTGVGVAGQQNVPKRFVLMHAMMFILGFTLVFVAFGATAGLFFSSLFGESNFRLTDFAPVLLKIGGFLLIILGLHMSGVFKWLASLFDETSVFYTIIATVDERLDMLILPERRVQIGQGSPPGLMRSGVVGMTFAAGWTPCVGPLLGGILGLAFNVASQTNPIEAVVQSAILLFAYSMGLAIPFFLTALVLTGAMNFLRQLNKYGHAIEMVSAIFLLGIGGVLLFGSFSELNRFFTSFPVPEWLADIEYSLLEQN